MLFMNNNANLMCDALYQKLKNGTKFTKQDSSKIPEIPGMCFAFEIDSTTKHNSKRIVYVGISDNLQKRIENHYKGITRFCKCVKFALTNQSSNNKQQLKQNISMHMEKHYYFIIAKITKGTDPKELKGKIISTITNCTNCMPPLSWLGNRSGLFDTVKQYGEILKPSDLSKIIPY